MPSPSPPQFYEFKGRFTYSLLGFMWARNANNGNAFNTSSWSFGVNLGLMTFVTQPDHLKIDSLDRVPELAGWRPLDPPFTRFFEQPFWPFEPPPAAGTADEKLELPLASWEVPPFFGDHKPAGFCPFSEVGFLDFTTVVLGTAKKVGTGTIAGSVRINTSGHNGGTPASVQGAYLFDGNNTSGAFTLQLVDIGLTNHVWDYVFSAVSADEFAISSANRLPRPGVGTGTLRRVI